MGAFGRIIRNPYKLVYGVVRKSGFLSKHISDKAYLKLAYRSVFGKKLNLDNPVTFNEKLQWLKLYDRNPLYTTLVDKYEVKTYVADKIGITHIIPTIGIWDRFEDIDFQKLPNSFVLKCTHDSGGVVICRDKAKLDIEALRKKIESCMKVNFFYMGREWPYKNVKPRIIAEKYMTEENVKDLRDYKFFCFNGNPKFCQVISDRSSNESIDFFDMEWKIQEFTGLGIPHKPHSVDKIEPPFTLKEMIEAAKKLSEGIPFVRVDFYEVNQEMYFGEMTFFPATGFGYFSPERWNLILGDNINVN